MPFCTKCGSEVKATAVFCTHCGARVKPVEAPRAAPPVSPVSSSQPRPSPAPKPGDAQHPHQAQSAAAAFFGFVATRLPMMIGSFAFSWVLHTYLLVVINDGFNKESWVAPYINLTGNGPSAVAIWTAASAISWYLVLSVVQFGAIKTFENVISTPFEMAAFVRGAGKRGLSAWVIGVGLGLYLASAINYQAQFTFGIAWLFVAMGSTGQILSRAVLFEWNRLIRLASVRRQASLRIDSDVAQLLVLGTPAGFVLAWLLPHSSGLLAGVALVACGIWYLLKVSGPRFSLAQLSGLLLIGGLTSLADAALAALFGKLAFADDGGFQESGGNLSTWWHNPGRDPAITRGLKPSMGAAAGALVPVNPTVRGAAAVSVTIGANALTESALREVYEQGAKQITERALAIAAQGGNTPDAIEQAARWAVEARNDLKAAIRADGSAVTEAIAEARNISKYGNPLGPGYEDLIRQGKTPARIIEGAGRSSESVNQAATRVRVVGGFIIVLNVGLVAWEVYEAPPGQVGSVLSGAAGRTARAWAGGELGAEGGALLGGTIGMAIPLPLAAPIGAAIGGVIGAIGGAIKGGELGQSAGQAIYSHFDGTASSIDTQQDAIIRGAAQR